MFVQRLKLRPPQLSTTWIERPALLGRFDSSGGVLSIVAGPGYGKTVLAAQVHATWSGPKGWYTLAAGDADLAVFTAHLETMIRTLGAEPPFAGESWRTGSPREVGSIFAEMLAAVGGRPLVVFDDVHVLALSRSLGVVGEFIERATRGGAVFVVTGRAMPLALHGFAAASRLVSVAARDLALDAVQARTYLARTTALRDPQALDELAQRAEGWPAGLALVATAAAAPVSLAMDAETPQTHPSGSRGSHDGDARATHGDGTRGPRDRDVRATSGEERRLDGDEARATSDDEARATHDDAARRAHDDEARRLLFEYLAAEVLDGLAPAERLFLLETSILDTLDVETCDRVTQRGDAAAILSALASRGLFVTRRTSDAYIVHQLFAEFLCHMLLRTRDDADVAALRRRAAAALDERGDRPAAIAQLLDAGDIDAAVEALETTAFAMLAGGLLSRVETLLGRIGRTRIEDSPTLLVACGRLDQLRGDWDAALASLERAIRDARERDRPDVLAEAVRVCAPILASRGEFARLLSLLESTLALGALSEAGRTALSMTLGAVLLENDRFDAALEVFARIMPSVVARGDLALQGMVLHNTAVAHVRRGDPYAALPVYERALRVKRSAGQRVSALLTLGNRIHLLRLLGDYDQAETQTRELLSDAENVGDAHLVAHAYENEGALKLLRADLAGAQNAFRKAQQACDPADALVLPDILHGSARAALALGDVAAADDGCVKALALLKTVNRRQPQAPLLLTRVECALAAGESSRALIVAQEALAAAEGPDALLCASVNLDVAVALVGAASQLRDAQAAEAERLALRAATTAVALLHQRDYRFLLRTKPAFAILREHFRRWGIGAGLVPEAPAAAPSLQIEMLGGLRIFVAGRPLAAESWKRRKARDIFAYLVSLRGTPVPRSRLIDLFWPETEADAAHDNLRVTISAIRKAVGDVVKFQGNAYRFVAPPNAVFDVEPFETHVEAARQALSRGDGDVARAAYAAAVELYRGEFLDGIEDGGWQWRERERLHAAALEALRWLAADAGTQPAFRREILDRLLEIAPFEIEAVRRRLDVMAGELRVAEARREYEAWKARYRAAVGAEPPEVWHAPLEAVPLGVSTVRVLSQAGR